MGRPPLNLRRTHVAFPREIIEEIDVLVGIKGRSAFIQKAVEQMLEAVRTAKSLEADHAERSE